MDKRENRHRNQQNKNERKIDCILGRQEKLRLPLSFTTEICGTRHGGTDFQLIYR